MAPEAETRDPVCHQTIHPMPGYARSEYQGRTYWFCDESCRKRFAKDPEKALVADREWVRQGGSEAEWEWVSVATVNASRVEEVLGALDGEGIEARVIEDFSSPRFIAFLPFLRPDGDVDYMQSILVRTEDARRARDFLATRGFLS